MDRESQLLALRTRAVVELRAAARCHHALVHELIQL